MSHPKKRAMKVQPFLLINTNVARPPVSPVGLEYVGEALAEAKLLVQVLDLAFPW
jgi:hypothetical protein